MTRCMALFFSTLTSALYAASPMADVVGKHLDVLRDGKPVLRYMYENAPDGERSFDTAKCFHHVLGPDGKTELTKGAGGKFPHHRGLYIGWSKIKHESKSWDLWHVKDTRQLHQRHLDPVQAADGAVTQGSIIHWVTPDGTVLIEEERRVTLRPDDAAHVVVDFVSTLKAVNGDLEIGGDPEHAGMQYRPNNEVADNKSARYLFHAEGIDPKKNKDLPWVAMTYILGADTWTVLHANHPFNPRGTVHSAYRDYGRFGAYTQFSLKNDESITLRYRIAVLPGAAPSREALQARYEDFATRGK